jgi:predicted nucleic acid-binding protein
LIESRQSPKVAIKDGSDVPILASAIAGRADVFVTGDAELLKPGDVEGVPVVSPRNLWMRLAGLEGRGR